jgi:hypothetical protein
MSRLHAHKANRFGARLDPFNAARDNFVSNIGYYTAYTYGPSTSRTPGSDPDPEFYMPSSGEWRFEEWHATKTQWGDDINRLEHRTVVIRKMSDKDLHLALQICERRNLDTFKEILMHEYNDRVRSPIQNRRQISLSRPHPKSNTRHSRKPMTSRLIEFEK